MYWIALMHLAKSVFLLALTVCLASTVAQTAPPATPPPQEDSEDVTIKIDVDLVNVFCSVRDKYGRFITNLTQDNFDLFDQKKPQEIRYFSLVKDLPLTIGLLVDVSKSQENLIEVEREAAYAFFRDVLRKKDMAFLISFGADTDLLQDMTNSPELLRAGLKELRLNAGAQPVLTPGTVPTIGSPKGTLLYEALYLAAQDKLRHEIGRKVLIVITDGVDMGSRISESEAIKEAQKADAIIYSILYYDPRYQMGFGSSGAGTLKKMSEDTGGRMFEVSRKHPLKEVFDLIQEEMRSQYLLGYAATNSEKDGSFHEIEIKTKPEKLKVQARKGYFAVKSVE